MGKMAAQDGAGQTQVEGKVWDLGVQILELPGLLSRAGLAQTRHWGSFQSFSLSLCTPSLAR